MLSHQNRPKQSPFFSAMFHFTAAVTVKGLGLDDVCDHIKDEIFPPNNGMVISAWVKTDKRWRNEGFDTADLMALLDWGLKVKVWWCSQMNLILHSSREYWIIYSGMKML